MMLLRIEQQKIRILKMSRDFTDLPTDKLADLKTTKILTALICDPHRKNQKTKEKSAVKNFEFYLSYIPNPTKTDRMCTSFYSLS